MSWQIENLEKMAFHLRRDSTQYTIASTQYTVSTVHHSLSTIHCPPFTVQYLASWLLVAGTWYLVLGTWFLVAACWELETGGPHVGHPQPKDTFLGIRALRVTSPFGYVIRWVSALRVECFKGWWVFALFF